MSRYPGKVIVDNMNHFVALTCDKGFLSYKYEAIFSEFISGIYKSTVTFIKKHNKEENKYLLNNLINILDEIETDGDFTLFYYQDLFKKLMDKCDTQSVSTK